MRIAALIRFAVVATMLVGSAESLLADDCDEFVSWVYPAKEAYITKHQIYPVPDNIQELAGRFMPRIWVHPDSWQPISFERYLSKATLIRKSDGTVLMKAPEPSAVAVMSHEEQCDAFLAADDIPPETPAPLYVQVFQDRGPVSPQENWLYIKFNPVFDWSGLAQETSWTAAIGAVLAGGNKQQWHRLDVHASAILAFDEKRRFRMLTLAQHNHQHTFLTGVDLPADQPPNLVAAVQSNELYLDNGESAPVEHRVVPFFNKVSFLITPDRKPWLYGIDVAYGRNAGGKEAHFYPVFLEPRHPLADFAGLLAPPKRIMGIYIGRDGPPGSNYYAPPSYFPLPDFTAMGYWRAGDTTLLDELTPFLGGLEDTDWEGMLNVFRKRLKEAMTESNTRFSEPKISAAEP